MLQVEGYSRTMKYFEHLKYFFRLKPTSMSLDLMLQETLIHSRIATILFPTVIRCYLFPFLRSLSLSIFASWNRHQLWMRQYQWFINVTNSSINVIEWNLDSKKFQQTCYASSRHVTITYRWRQSSIGYWIRPQTNKTPHAVWRHFIKCFTYVVIGNLVFKIFSRQFKEG